MDPLQTVYATHLALPPSSGDSSLDEAVEAVVAWVRRRFDVDVTPLSGGQVATETATIKWESLFGDARGVIGISIDQTDEYDAAWRWRTYVDVGVEDRSAWVRVRVALYSPLEGRLTNPKVQAGRPGAVRALAQALHIEVDGWEIGAWRPVHRRDVDAYVRFLTDPARQLPVVALSADRDGETFLDPARTNDRLLGLAHVVAIDQDASFSISDAVGKHVSCFGGAVRIYWPGFRPSDDPYDHRLFVGGTLTFLGREGLERELFETLGRLAGLSLAEPPLRRRLMIERAEAETRERKAELAAASQRLEETEATSLDQATFDEFVAEYKAMEDRVNEADEDLINAAIEIETLQKERDDALTQVAALAKALSGGGDPIAQQEVVDPPADIHSAVEQAASTATHTVFLEEAYSSAAESSYPDPVRAFEDLRLIDEIARDWATGELAAGPNQAFRERCSGYRDGIGQIASTQYAGDYQRSYNGTTIMLGPHIRRGIGSVAAILRIYMWFDTESQKIVVGHVGKKLRDTSNRN